MRILVLLLALALPVMAGREFVAGSSEFGTKAAPVATYPVTVAVRFLAYATNANLIMSAVHGASDNRRLALYLSPGGTLNADAIEDGGTTPRTASTTTRASSNTWHSAVGIWDSATSRRVWLNAGGSGTNTTSASVTSLTVLGVGARRSSGTWGLHFNGVLAELAVWDVALSLDEIQSLSDGASPLLIRPASRVSYIPMIGQESGSEVDFHGVQLGLTNTPAPSGLHPRVYRP